MYEKRKLHCLESERVLLSQKFSISTVHVHGTLLPCCQFWSRKLYKCCEQPPWWEAAKMWVLYGHARCATSMQFCENSISKRWHMLGCGFAAHSLDVLNWWRDHFVGSGYKFEHHCKTTATIVRKKGTITDTVQSMLHYAGAFEEAHGVRFVDVCLIKIVGDVISLNCLAANCSVTYIC